MPRQNSPFGSSGYHCPGRRFRNPLRFERLTGLRKFLGGPILNLGSSSCRFLSGLLPLAFFPLGWGPRSSFSGVEEAPRPCRTTKGYGEMAAASRTLWGAIEIVRERRCYVQRNMRSPRICSIAGFAGIWHGENQKTRAVLRHVHPR